MSLIHTCELNGVNPSDYLMTELQRLCSEVEQAPAERRLWTYRDTLARMTSRIAA